MEKTVEKESKLSHDGKQLLTRIPKVIEEKARLKKGEKILWKTDGKKIEVEKQ